jgi:peptidoglycan/xylan/chitin deacetylase (PgdA/CDA1 family)
VLNIQKILNKLRVLVNLRRVLIIVLLLLTGPATILAANYSLPKPLPRFVYAKLYNYTTGLLKPGSTRKTIALTFDDGPDPRYTPQILRILKEEHVPATFFMVGKNIEQYPEIAKQVVAQNETIGNHTYSHPDLNKTSRQEMKSEILKTETIIYRTTGTKPKFFRPPKGLSNAQIDNFVKISGYRIVLWDETVEHKSAKTPAEMANRIVRLTVPGSIILAHDGRLNRETTVSAVPIIIRKLKSEGYTFVSLDELIKSRRNS